MGKSSTSQTTTTTPQPGPRINLELAPSLTDKATYISNRPDMANPFAHAAEITGDERSAYDMVRNLMGRYQGTLDTGLNAQLEALARSSRAPTQGDLQGYMNPFTENVLNRTIERIQEQGDKNYKDIGARAALSGAFGGSRQGLLEGMNAADTQRTIGDTYYSGMKENYDQALANYLGSIDRMSNMAGRAITGAGAGQAYGLTDASALENIGLSQRNRNDKELGLQREEWANIYNEPYKELEALALATQALTPVDVGQKSTTTQTQANNPLTQLLGLGSTIGSLFTGGASSGLGALLGGSSGGNGIWSMVKGWKGGGSVTTDPDDVASSDADKVAEIITLLFSEGGSVKKPKGYAYGGRVGNSFSMGESADVIRNTQNPFNGMGQASVPGGYNPVLGNNGGLEGPLRDEVQGGIISPEVADLMPNLNAVTDNPLTYNAGFTSPDTLIKPDVGGNPVAKLLGDYKNGIRTAQPQNFMGTATLDGYAEGGHIKPGGNPVASFANGGNVGGSLIDSLFGKQNLSDTLLKLGISMLSNPQANPLEALGGGLGNLVAEQQKMGQANPLDQLKLEYQQLRNQDILAKMEDREADNAWQRERFDRTEERMYAGMGAAEERAARAEAARERRQDERWAREDEREARRDAKPANFSSSDFPGLNDDIKILTDPEKTAQEKDAAVKRLEIKSESMEARGYSNEANELYSSYVKPYKAQKKKVDTTKNVMDSFYSILGQ